MESTGLFFVQSRIKIVCFQELKLQKLQIEVLNSNLSHIGHHELSNNAILLDNPN